MGRVMVAVSQSVVSQDRFLKESGIAGAIADLVAPTLGDLGFRLVCVQIMGRERSQTVQIMAERPDGTISIDDCETISRQLSPLLDAFDVVPGSYRLEISSPGIDRPLVRASDFEDWAGYEAKVELSEPIDGRKRFRGVLEGFDEQEVRLEVVLDQVGRQVLGLPVEMIDSARLVLTDELVRESLRRSKDRQIETEKPVVVDDDRGADEPAGTNIYRGS
ncbi:MAG: ribosome maturation factor RimP [Hyphomicrobiaceae bacterium]